MGDKPMELPRMKTILLSGLLVLAAGFLGCSTAYHVYQGDMWEGKRLLGQGDYGKAHEHFVKAAKALPDEAYPYAFAATSSCKMNDLEAASRFIEEAAKRGRQRDAQIRIKGYKALILLKQGKEKEGLQALDDYMLAYQKDYAPDNVREVRAMWRSNRIDLAALQQLLDEEIGIYESDLDQFRRTGTGWFALRYGATSATDGAGTRN
jgi:uncharacterized protein HemY